MKKLLLGLLFIFMALSMVAFAINKPAYFTSWLIIVSLTLRFNHNAKTLR